MTYFAYRLIIILFYLFLEVWSCIFNPVRKLREEGKLVKIFPEFVTGEVIRFIHLKRDLNVATCAGIYSIFFVLVKCFGQSPVEKKLKLNPMNLFRN